MLCFKMVCLKLKTILNILNQLKIIPKIVQKFLNFILPIRANEIPMFLSITGLMFCILFTQNLIRALKDSIVNTLIGTEIISFLKFWGVMPASFLIVMIYVKIIDYIDSRKIFYCVITFFIFFFLLFAFYIFPNHTNLHLSDEKINLLTQKYIHLKWFILLFAKWGFSLFYIVAELWPNVILGLLFWQFINQITTVEQSKRFYGLFGIIGQTGLFISGQFLMQTPIIANSIINQFNLTGSVTLVSVQIILALSTLLCVVGVYFFWLLNRFIKIDNIIIKPKQKHNLTLLESFSMIARSRYIRLIATLMICYGVAINLVETPWKSSAAKNYTEVENYAAFTGKYLTYTGICTGSLVLVNLIIIYLFIILNKNSIIIRKFGWFVAAIITPITVCSTGLLFFITKNFPSFNYEVANLFFISDPLILVIVLGMIQNTLSKSTKYTFFDVTKEMAYVPLDSDLKTKGKAAVDVIATKVGKSLSSLIQSMVFILLPNSTYESISVYLMYVFAAICLIWIWTVKQLAAEYNSITTSKPV